MVEKPSTADAYRGESDTKFVRTAQEEINASHSSDPANISEDSSGYDPELMEGAAEAFEQFETYPVMTDGGHDGRDPRVIDAEDYAGVTMERPGNSVDQYDDVSSSDENSQPIDNDPHTEGPNYEEWATGFEDDEAIEAFSGLFES